VEGLVELVEAEDLPAGMKLVETRGRRPGVVGRIRHGSGLRVDRPSQANVAVDLEPVRASYSVTSCHLRILMDQPTKSISPHHPPSRHDDRWLARPHWRQLSQGTVWAVNVVMVDELS
jgi:hypothetical protein